MSDPFAEWRIDEACYPRSGSPRMRMRFLLGYAILAPSGHNTQPWRFRLTSDGAELIADRARRLPVVDPHDRALVISCGAALGHLRTAIRYFGHEAEVSLLPDARDPDLLARVRFGPPRAPSPRDIARFRAITRRRTTRLAYADETLPPRLREALLTAAAEDGCAVALVERAADKQAMARLVAEGGRGQMGNAAFRRELAAWVHSRRAASRDGMSGAAFGMPDVLSAVGGLVIRTFDMGEGQAAKDEEVASGSPALAVLASADDAPHDWLCAGLALSAVLLELTAAGWTSAFLNQPIETDHLRPRLRDAVHLPGCPQLLFRVGRGEPIDPAVRRPVAEVLLEET